MKRILLIESNPEERNKTAETLEIGGYKVELARHGREGLRKAEVIKPDLIISGIQLKGGDGYSILYSIRQDKNLDDIPFIMIAESSKREDRRRAMEMGADDFISLPFSQPELLKSVENQIKRYNLLRNKFSGKDEKDKRQNYHEEPWVRVIIQDRKIQHYKEGDQIYRNGNYPGYVYYLLEGQVKLFYLNEKGKELITDIVTSGEFFGYECVIINREYSQNSMALVNSKILRISSDEFNSILQGDGNLANGLLEVISLRIPEKENDMLSLAYDSVKVRIGSRLLYLSTKFESNTLEISRTDLASLAGTSMETVVRVLSDFNEEGTIELDNHKIILKDIKALKKG
jgi:CRP-like cAMP-binding protein/AmiR/NasT family two-component response regulator